MVHTGSASGQLDKMLASARDQMDDESKRARTALLVAVGAACFGLAILTAVWQIVSFWMGYMDQINKAF